MTPEIEAAARAAYETWIAPVRDLEPSWDDLPESHRDRLRESATAALAAAAAVRSGPPESVEPVAWKPLDMDEIIEVGRAILPYIDSEKTQNVGAIAHDAAVTVMNILRARAEPSQEHQTT